MEEEDFVDGKSSKLRVKNLRNCVSHIQIQIQIGIQIQILIQMQIQIGIHKYKLADRAMMRLHWLANAASADSSTACLKNIIIMV